MAKLSFADDTLATAVTSFPEIGNARGASEDGVAAFIAGKYQDPSWFTMPFATDVVAITSYDMDEYRQAGMVMGNDSYAWWRHGYTSHPWGRFATSTKIQYSNGTTSAGTSGSFNGNSGCAVSNESGNTGYVSGAYTDNGEVTTTDKYALGSDTRSSGPASPQGESGGATCTNNGVCGYRTQNNMSGTYEDILKLTYSTDTWSELTDRVGNFYRHTGGGTGISNKSGGYSYMAGSMATTIDKIANSNDTSSAISAPLPDSGTYTIRDHAVFANGWTV